MIYSLKVIFGKEQVIKTYDGAPLSNDEEKINIKEFNFNSILEKEAFIEGMNQAMGWNEFCIPEIELNEDI